jgi:hypothetical protein
MADEPSDDLMVLGADSFPYFRTMDRNPGVSLKAELHISGSNVEHRDLQQAMEAIGPADHYRFPILPGLD